jgi:membrane associated rhomboid family serine protease
MFSNLPPVTKALLIANALVFLLQQALGDVAFAPFMLWPIGSGGDPTIPGVGFGIWQLLTYGFLHGSWSHIIFNMLALFMFGAPLEYTWGQKRYLAYYLVCMVGAGLCQLVVGAWMMAQGSGAYPTIGASGAIFGLLLAYGMLFGWMMIRYGRGQPPFGRRGPPRPRIVR